MILTTLSNSYKWNQMVFVSLWLDYSLLRNVLKVRPCCNTLQNSFHGWIIPVVCLSHIWVASTFWQLWAMLCTWVYRYFLEICFQFFWIYSRVSEVTQSCPTLCDPMDCSLPGSSVHGIFQVIVLEWVAISFSRGSSQPRDWTRVSHIVDRRFTIWATRENMYIRVCVYMCIYLVRVCV